MKTNTNQIDLAGFQHLYKNIGFLMCRETNVIIGSVILLKETEATYKFIWGFMLENGKVVPRYLNKHKKTFLFCKTEQEIHDYYINLAKKELKWANDDYATNKQHLFDYFKESKND